MMWGLKKPRPQGFSVKKNGWGHFLREKPWGRGWGLKGFREQRSNVSLLRYETYTGRHCSVR